MEHFRSLRGFSCDTSRQGQRLFSKGISHFFSSQIQKSYHRRISSLDPSPTYPSAMATNNQVEHVKDWRIKLLGPTIRMNSPDAAADVEQPLVFIPTDEALSDKQYDYIALFLGADYCPHCKRFAPKVLESLPYFEKNKCKVVFVSNDRNDEAFAASCKKNAGIDVMPYDTSKTRAMRDLFELNTIPALIVIANKDFDAPPAVLANGRTSLETDPYLRDFPWNQVDGDDSDDKTQSISAANRLIICGKYGKWWQLGHFANPSKPKEMYMDEHAVRARAGILNAITWIAMMNIFFLQNHTIVKVLFPLIAYEFLMSSIFGLTPLAPIGLLGTLLAILLHPQPLWKPAKPKRFAWLVGLTLATLCFFFFSFREQLGPAYRPLVATVVGTCNFFTWLESACGFCVGCFVYNTFLTKWFHLEECSECKI